MKTILFAAPHFFSGAITVGGQNYALQFCRAGYKVAYISTFLSPFKLIREKDRLSIKTQWSNFRNNGEYVKNNLWSYVPLTLLPHHNKTAFDTKWLLNNYHLFSPVNLVGLLERNGFTIPVDLLWIDSPQFNFWKKVAKPKFCIYRVTDNLQGFNYLGKALLRAETEGIESADLVLVASKVLSEKLRNKFGNTRIIYCPNGANIEHFIKKEYSLPPEYKDIMGKKALYVGAIDDWFDTDLLVYSARKSPDVTFIIIGPDKKGILKKISSPNIRCLGGKPYSVIPDYIYHCDFGIIPFSQTELVQTINPIKMFEFFSLGKPVVSTSWEELRECGAPCHRASTKEQFADLVNDTLPPDAEKVSSLMEFAKNNSWVSRFSYIESLLPETICR